MDSSAFPWLKHLPEDEQREFVRDLGASFEIHDNWDQRLKVAEQTIAVWRASAQAYADGLESEDLTENLRAMREFEELTGLKASEGIPVAKVKSLKGVVGALMWLAYLPEDEQRQFWEELFGALDDVVCDQDSPSAADYAQAAGPVLYAWKSTAQAHADGLPEILATVTPGDFGEVLPPYQPGYVKGSIIEVKPPRGRERGRRYRVMELRGGSYLLKALFSSLSPEYVWWDYEGCDHNTRLEWQDTYHRVGRLSGDGLSVTELSPADQKSMGLTVDG